MALADSSKNRRVCGKFRPQQRRTVRLRAGLLIRSKKQVNWLVRTLCGHGIHRWFITDKEGSGAPIQRSEFVFELAECHVGIDYHII
jgi:hypothetical protein